MSAVNSVSGSSWSSTIRSVCSCSWCIGDRQRRVRQVVQVAPERALAELRVLARHQDHLVPGLVDGLGRHPDQVAVGVQAGEVPGAQALERDVGLARVAELVAQLAMQRGRELVGLDEAAPPGAAHSVEHRHGADGRAAPAPQLATQGGGFPTSAQREPLRRASRARPAARRATRRPRRSRPARARARSRARRRSARPRRRTPPARCASGGPRRAAGPAPRRAAPCPDRCPPAPPPAAARRAPAANRRAPRAAAARARPRAPARRASAPLRPPPVSPARPRGCPARCAGRPRAARTLLAAGGRHRRLAQRAPALETLRRLLGQRAGEHGFERRAPAPAAAARTGAPRVSAPPSRARTRPARSARRTARSRASTGRSPGRRARRGSAPARRSRASRPARRCGSRPALASSALTSPKSVRYA